MGTIDPTRWGFLAAPKKSEDKDVTTVYERRYMCVPRWIPRFHTAEGHRGGMCGSTVHLGNSNQQVTRKVKVSVGLLEHTLLFLMQPTITTSTWEEFIFQISSSNTFRQGSRATNIGRHSFTNALT